MKYFYTTTCLIIFFSCSQINQQDVSTDTIIKTTAPNPPVDSAADTLINLSTTTQIDSSKNTFIQTKNVQPSAIINFAQTLIGTPYLYASTDPSKGFDCSGFITYVFNHFNIEVPRSSVEFTNVYHEVPLQQAKPGDLILFTGTDSSIRIVGHMGIVISNINDSIAFIHSSSGKADGVTITPLNSYYMGRFVKVVRVFPENDLAL